MKTITVKMPPELEATVDALAAKLHQSRSQVVREAIRRYIRQHQQTAPSGSLHSRADDLVGCFEGGPRDLSSNDEQLSGFGSR
jgi:Arc/MetJ-type ribon-helix-helix transcriptional regulator